jgi:carbonic anhydrase
MGGTDYGESVPGLTEVLAYEHEDGYMSDASDSTRRDFLVLGGAAGLWSAGTRLGVAELARQKAAGPRAVTPDEALQHLLDGNARFVKGQSLNPRRSPSDFRALAEGQYPEAVVVGCADSRVPPEIVFDTGLGDLFVVRVAGNVISGAGAAVKGSIEYAVAELNVPLILVLGHSGCGAVKAALQRLDAKQVLPGAIDGLVDLVEPAVVASKAMPGDPVEQAVRKNIELGVEHLRTLEPILAPRIRQAKLRVAGAVYDLKTGAVTLVKEHA